MTQKIPRCHFPILEKLSQLFFETQKISTTRYALLPNTPMTNLKNYIIGCKDRLLNFSTSYIYLVSGDTQSLRAQTSLINTMQKLVDNTRINQTEASIPEKEMHGLQLAASNALKSLTNHPGNQDNHKSSLSGFRCTLTSCGPVKTSADTKAQIKKAVC